MIRMERIDARNQSRITYRGTLKLIQGRNDPNPYHIQTEEFVETPNGWSLNAERQCMLEVVDRLLRIAKREIVDRLDQQIYVTGTYDTTAPEQLRGRAVRRNGRESAHFILDDEACTARTERTNPLTTPALGEMRRSVYEALRSTHIEPAIPIDLTMALPSFNPFLTKRDTPERRAMALLARKIGKARYRALVKKGFFEEQGRHGLYLFHKTKEGGVTFHQKIQVGKLKERKVSWDLCVQSQAPYLPNGDVILSRWLEWKLDEDRFLETANFRNIRTMDEAKEHPVYGESLLASMARATGLPSYMMGLVYRDVRS